MLINFINPVHPVDGPAQTAFVAILNIILLSQDLAEANRRLWEQNKDPEYRKLSGYFHWSSDGNGFSLRQRIGYNSAVCFGHIVLEVNHISVCHHKTVTTEN